MSDCVRLATRVSCGTRAGLGMQHSGAERMLGGPQDLNLGPMEIFEKAMLLIRLASSCVMHDDNTRYWGGCSRMVLDFEPVNEP